MKNHLTALRAKHGWTQADLAEGVDVSRQTINAIEKEKFDPSLPVAFRIAKVSDRTIEEILSYDNDRTGKP